MTYHPTQALTLILIGTLLLGGCDKKSTGEPAEPAARNVNVQAMTVKSGRMAVTVSTPGSVVAEQQAQIASRIMGFIRKINVDIGQHVVAGQQLLAIDPADIEGQVDLSKANVAQAEAAFADAKNDYQRFGDLYREQAIPKAQWDKVRLQYELARQQEIAAKAGQVTAGSQMRYATLKAPFAGIVTQKTANAGDLAAPGKPLMTIENPDTLQVQTQVSSDVYAHLQLGTPVSLHTDHPDAWLAGTVSRLVAASDPVSHTYLVKIAVPPNHVLQSGMYVQVVFTVGHHEGVQVPDNAILERAGITGVFVLDNRDIAHYRMVRKGDSANGMTAILAGLNPGERVVVSPPADLQSGDKAIIAEVGHV
ncbi:MAG TPA: efflux RND transporter periplasmic adaptor subunit [Burkholderiales bacterium]|nr:efflux RND transporter periplasmic adaptor subunit [Burkholderiales bacterium]